MASNAGTIKKHLPKKYRQKIFLRILKGGRE
jgi:hypothetical protein